MSYTVEEKAQIVIKFAGDSGDGMQLTGSQFTHSSALSGHDLATFPDFPAEIRAPAGTLPGVSGFQLQFGGVEINSPGDIYDVLVAMNAAALKMNLQHLVEGGILILNTEGFGSKNLKLAGYEPDQNPLDDEVLADKYRVYKIDITKLTRESLAESPLEGKVKDRSKNMFVLGFLYWMFSREIDATVQFLEQKFQSKPEMLKANLKALKDGYHFGETTEVLNERIEVRKTSLGAGTYRNIIGNQALALGLLTFAAKSGMKLLYGAYPITPASDILHELNKHKDFGVIPFQAEDEIAAVTAAIGASFGGNLGITGTSGPGMALKAEAVGLAVSTELPLVIINVQRAGPSTGMPTKTEQADLLQSVYGRNGECPVPVIAAATAGDCFEMAYEACSIAVEHMTPVILLSDGYIANGSAPWLIPNAAEYAAPKINRPEDPENYRPFERNEELVRAWAIPGMKGFEHRIGGLEKAANTGNVSYDPPNHEYMTKTRLEKVLKLADHYPEVEIDEGADEGDLLILGWGSTYGSIRTAILDLQEEGYKVSHLHLKYLFPFQHGLEKIFSNFKQIMVPEINNGQLIKMLKENFGHQFTPLNKIQGLPFTKVEIIENAKILLK